ncbi:MAG: branched-chain amino acid ABC transporter permease LivH, partial [Alphaproteobacteria bacterium]|nr:branched-chain amino acid ABC transporter permease LivH [Alphaproteobacteria bacterium]
IAIGYTMVYGILGMVNFAHGDVFMIGGFVAVITFLLLGVLGLTWIPFALICMLLMAMVFTGLHGWAIERIGYRALRNSNRLAPLISAVGMSIFLQNYVQILQGARNKALSPIISGGVELMTSPTGFTVKFGYMQMVIWITAAVLMIGFSLLIARTSLGRQQRACEQDMKMARLLGVDVDRTISLTFIMGAALAAVAGLVWLLYYGIIDFYVGFLAGIKAFTAAVLGGIGSLPGAMLGGLLIGLIEVFWSAYFSVEYKDVAAFAILVLVLIFRPTGLLGQPDIEKV